MDEVFRALADPSRRRLLDSLNARNGQSLRELCSGLELARQSVSKHLAVLEAANLVTTLWRGREKLHFLNPVPIQAVADRWMTRYDRERTVALADLKSALEGDPMGDSTEFVYTTYIKTSADRLWQALTEPAFTRRYWATTFETDWQPGSPMVWVDQNGHQIRHPEQVVLESEPPRRLSYTWHTFTPEWADGAGVSEDNLAALRTERRSKVTFDLEPAGDLVRLTVIHADCEPDGQLLRMISGGWPRLLSDLKTLLETGEPTTAVPEPAEHHDHSTTKGDPR